MGPRAGQYQASCLRVIIHQHSLHINLSGYHFGDSIEPDIEKSTNQDSALHPNLQVCEFAGKKEKAAAGLPNGEGGLLDDQEVIECAKFRQSCLPSALYGRNRIYDEIVQKPGFAASRSYPCQYLL